MRHLTTAALTALLTAAVGCSNDNLYDFDGDGVTDADDCEPENPDIYPGAGENCTDGIDNDCDGDVDLEDGECLVRGGPGL